MFSVNNAKVTQECSQEIINRGCMYSTDSTIKFCNKAHHLDVHISNITLDGYSRNMRLKRSPTVQYDHKVRKLLNTEFKGFYILNNHPRSSDILKNITIKL